MFEGSRTNPDAGHTDSYTGQTQKSPDKPERLSHYDADQVLAGWRRYQTRGNRVRRARPDGRLSADERDAPPTTEEYLDVDLLQWLKVEAFFRENFHLHTQRAALLMGDYSPGRATAEFLFMFRVWLRYNPIAMVYIGDSYRVVAPEHEPLSLTEAVDRWNARARNKDLRKKLDAIEKTLIGKRSAVIASRETKADGQIIPPRLTTWSPEGKRHTTLNEIYKWLVTDKRRNFGKK